MWNHKLDIGDVNMQILRDNTKKGGYKELLIGYKTIYINTYNLVVIDLSGDEAKRATLFRHESFQLWESEVRGIMLESSKDFITVNKDGINVVALGSTAHRPVVDANGIDRMLHSLESMAFLKVDPDNHLNFAS